MMLRNFPPITFAKRARFAHHKSKVNHAQLAAMMRSMASLVALQDKCCTTCANPNISTSTSSQTWFGGVRSGSTNMNKVWIATMLLLPEQRPGLMVLQETAPIELLSRDLTTTCFHTMCCVMATFNILCKLATIATNGTRPASVGVRLHISRSSKKILREKIPIS